MPRIAVRNRSLTLTTGVLLLVLLPMVAGRVDLSLASYGATVPGASAARAPLSGSGADVNNVSLQAMGLPMGNQGLCGEFNLFTLRNVLHNNGPDTPADVAVANTVAVPAPVDILFRVSNANQSITINGVPLDCTAPGGPAIYCSNNVVAGVAPVGTVVEVRGDKSPGTVLRVRQTLSLAQSVQTNVDQTWAFMCMDDGNIPLHWESMVDVLAPGFDTDSTNNVRSLDVVLDCLAATAVDLAIVQQSVSHAPAPRPPLTLPTLLVGEGNTLGLRKDLLNGGPKLQATANIVASVSLAYAGMDPVNGDCVVTPNPATAQLALLMGTPVTHDEDFNITCGQGGIGIDDDLDGYIDEDFVDGVDSDADTRIDEDSRLYLTTVTITNTIESDDPCVPEIYPTDNAAVTSVTLAVGVVGNADPVGGLASLPQIAGASSSPTATYAALAAGLAAAILAAVAGLWCARRRWVR